MAVKTIKLDSMKHHSLKFRDSMLAHQYLGNLEGIEIGPAAHNPFSLIGSTSVGLGPDIDLVDYEFFKQAQVDMCGEYAVIEISSEADLVPLPSASQDYVITSHVVEHLSDLIGVYKEWNRLLKDNGYIFMIFPKRGALQSDTNRPISTLNDFIRAYRETWTPDTIPQEVLEVSGGERGHIWVFTLQSMIDLIEACNEHHYFGWEIIEALETDDKVGNGHCIVARKKVKNVTPKETQNS